MTFVSRNSVSMRTVVSDKSSRLLMDINDIEQVTLMTFSCLVKCRCVKREQN